MKKILVSVILFLSIFMSNQLLASPNIKEESCLEAAIKTANVNQIISQDNFTTANKIDTDFTGQYLDKWKNEVTIKGPAKDGAIIFEIHIATASGCMADISGMAYLTGPGLASYYDDPKVSKCQLNFSFDNGVLEIMQSEECQYYGGPSCGLTGTYTKKD
jgi:hypothetical protein